MTDEEVMNMPSWVKRPYSDNARALAETLGNIRARTEEWTALRKEQEEALAWCRANGNPHRKGSKQ